MTILQLSGSVIVVWGEGAEAVAVACSVQEVVLCSVGICVLKLICCVCNYVRRCPRKRCSSSKHCLQNAALVPRALTASDKLMCVEGGRAVVQSQEVDPSDGAP